MTIIAPLAHLDTRDPERSSAKASEWDGRSHTVWPVLSSEARDAANNDPRLAQAMVQTVLCHPSFAEALAHRFSQAFANEDVGKSVLMDLALEVFAADPEIIDSAAMDLQAVFDRDPSTSELLVPFLYFKGFLALQAYRVGHWLWQQDKRLMARHVQSRICEVVSIDIHPAAHLGRGIMLDHGNGLVIGETAVVEDDVSIL